MELHSICEKWVMIALNKNLENTKFSRFLFGNFKYLIAITNKGFTVQYR
ncbi:hypothetical protein G9F72_000175 [Clostridium estertheticum]|nr:hypothetical protein [Clostridium estertheticum]MBZ9684814.1 hypothetical protein [Clostridium estertheticum]